MSLGNKLRCLRNEHGLTQEQLAEQFHVSRQTISKWELDQMMPETAKLLEIAEFFDASLDELLLDKEDSALKILREQKEAPSEPQLSTYEPHQQIGETRQSTADSRRRLTSFRLTALQKLQLGGIILLSVLLLWNPAPNTTHFSPMNLVDNSFVLILAVTLALCLLFKVLFRQKVKLSRLIAVLAVCIGFGFSFYYFYVLLRSGNIGHGVRVALLPLYYGILLGFAASFGDR